ncbi:MAG: ABC transporter permease [Solirubrobacterales bacterium]|nr:ABC transporter permease [Solirubrobacterales bacterium]MBV9164941.1 ABC transporter permease [Solirubrobacterales bacterium]MBV9534700.1 ABC transporter permease [Solirubrobacterales bacterium]
MALGVPRFRRNGQGSSTGDLPTQTTQGSSTEDLPTQTTQDPSFALPEAGGVAARPEPLVGRPPAEPEGPSTVGVGPYRLAFRRLRRNKTALFFGAVFIAIVIVCVLAPVYSHDVAHIGPNVTNPTGTVNGKSVLSTSGVPIGPTFTAHYFFGADSDGRDLAVRLLYGGRTSLIIGGIATIIIIVFGTLVGLLAGYFRGVVDAVLRPLMELIWSFPPVILGVAVGTALALGGIGPIKGNSIFIPAFIIGVIYIPYLGKPIRGEVLRLREMDFVDAARVQGMHPWRIMLSEILPNATSTIIVFIPMMLATSILLEAYLSFLGAGVQAPNASWGTLISDGITYLDTTPSFALIPGAMLVLTVLSINILGDGVRDALDPRAQVKIQT